MRFPKGTPVSPAMKTPPKNQPDEGEAENRFPFASATLILVVSGEVTEEGAAVHLAVARLSIGALGIFRLAPGWKLQGSPGRIELFAPCGSIRARRAAA